MPSFADQLRNAAKQVQAQLQKAGDALNKHSNLGFGAKKSRRVKKVKKSRSKKSRSRKSSKKSKRKTSRRKSKSRKH